MKNATLTGKLIFLVAFSLGLFACSDDSETSNELTGKWIITSEEWKSIVDIDNDSFQSEDYKDEDGYGFFCYQGKYSGSVLKTAYSISFFTSADHTEWAGSNLIGKKFEWTERKDGMIARDEFNHSFAFDKYNDSKVKNQKDIYGAWVATSCSGTNYDNNGDVQEELNNTNLLPQLPSFLAFSENPLKGEKIFNAYAVRSRGKSYEETYTFVFNLNGKHLEMSGSDVWWFDDSKTWTLLSVDERFLKFAVEGQDGTNDYLDFTVTYSRIKIL